MLSNDVRINELHSKSIRTNESHSKSVRINETHSKNIGINGFKFPSNKQFNKPRISSSIYYSNYSASFSCTEIVTCKKCHKYMKFNIQNMNFRCTNRLCSTTIHAYSPLPFESVKADINKILFIFACFCADFSIHTTHEVVGMSMPTIIHWFDIFRQEMIRKNLNEMTSNPIKDYVQIEESIFTKRKNHVGRIVPQQWVFGGCDGNKGGRVYFFPVPNRKKETLQLIIKLMIAPSSLIVSDELKSYSYLNKDSYSHLTVNHSQNFVDPQTLAHTQRIESLWAAAKLWRRKKGYFSD